MVKSLTTSRIYYSLMNVDMQENDIIWRAKKKRKKNIHKDAMLNHCIVCSMMFKHAAHFYLLFRAATTYKYNGQFKFSKCQVAY